MTANSKKKHKAPQLFSVKFFAVDGWDFENVVAYR